MKLARKLRGTTTKFFAHYDASVTSSIISSSNIITQWSDISGNNQHLVNTVYPEYLPTYNFGSSVQCSNQYLHINDELEIDVYGPGIGAIIFVYNWTSTSGGYRHCMSHSAYWHGSSLTTKLLDPSYAAFATRNSSCLRNGTTATPTLLTRDTNKVVLSFKTTEIPIKFIGVGGFQGGGFHTSRGFTGKYYEIRVFKEVPTDAELLTQHQELMLKWSV